MHYLKKALHLFDNYVLARFQNRPSTALFWYLPEPPNIKTKDDLLRYQKTSIAPFFLMDYSQKLKYSLENKDGIIVLPYDQSIGQQVNPEAAFQYALGLHDQFCISNDSIYLSKFLRYAKYFLSKQSKEGLFEYHFDWYGSKAPWSSALAQARGASVMLRAWMHSNDVYYINAAKHALTKFSLSTKEGGFLHLFTPANCAYFEEYPSTPTGVINGFMASLMSIWELKYWTQEKWLDDLWQLGINSLQKMLPYYTIDWWSLYDLDEATPILNVNSPRYHLLEIHYLQILSVLSESPILIHEYKKRINQYDRIFSRQRALGLKLLRKIIYK